MQIMLRHKFLLQNQASRRRSLYRPRPRDPFETQLYERPLTSKEIKKKLAEQNQNKSNPNFHPILKELQSSVLSAASLGLNAPRQKIRKKSSGHRGWYKRNGVKIIKMYFGPRRNNLQRWDAVLIRPLRKWYPSKCASFIFGLDMDPEYLVKITPEHFNPSVWSHTKDQHVALRVPKDRQDETCALLKKRKFWFNTKDRRWYPRKLGPVRQMYRHSKFNPKSKRFVGRINAKNEASKA